MDDWAIFHAGASQRNQIPEITCRCKKDGQHNAIVMPCQYEFKFMGYTFVSHRNPDRKAYIDAGVPFGDWHISEIHTGFNLSFGSSRDDARQMARKILIKQGPGIRKAMQRANEIIGAHRWVTKMFFDPT